MDKQEIFDKVAVHLLTQMKKSLITFFGCAYRSDDGLKCAIGVLIPDNKYHGELEGEGAGCCAVLEAIGVGYELGNFLEELQEIHDGHQPQYWQRELREFADENNLSTAAIDDLK